MKNQKGFNLIELLITVSIIGIITGIAVPSYNQHITNKSRNDATTTLLELMRAEEDFYANEFIYTTELEEINANNYTSAFKKSVTNSFTVSSERYYITAQECTGIELSLCVELKATPINAQDDDGDKGGEFTLNSRGERTYDTSPGWPK